MSSGSVSLPASGGGLVLGAPMVEAVGGSGVGSVVAVDRNGQNILSKTVTNVFVRDSDPAIFTDASLAARVELLVYTKRHNQAGINTGSPGPVARGWHHPSNWVGGIDVTGRRTSGGGHYDVTGTALPDRQSEQLLFGLSEFQRIDITSWIGSRYEIGQVRYYPDGPTSPVSFVNVPIFVGGNGAYSRYGNSALPNRFGYANVPMKTYWSTRILAFPNGTTGDPVAGPWSQIVVCRPNPWPMGFDITGRPNARATSSIVQNIGSDVSGSIGP